MHIYKFKTRSVKQKKYVIYYSMLKKFDFKLLKIKPNTMLHWQCESNVSNKLHVYLLYI